MDQELVRSNQIKVFFNPKQVATKGLEGRTSQSPRKPALVCEHIKSPPFAQHFSFEDSFPPFNREDFLLAHDSKYVDAVFSGKGTLCESNRLPWSRELVTSVQMTNASLYNALRYAIINPETVTFSPTSGFHHARPTKGEGFCTFSGQVIAALKLRAEFGVSGAWIDLDAHRGNSIEDSRWVIEGLNEAIPEGCNINPRGMNREYLEDLRHQLNFLREMILRGRVHYVGFAHGADSHINDDLEAGKVTAREWLEASYMVYEWVRDLDREREKPLPLTLSLFGGYRKDDYDTVIHLHVADLLVCLKTLVNRNIDFDFQISSM